MAARGGRAAIGADAADRRADEPCGKRSGRTGPYCRVPGGLAKLGWTEGRDVQIEYRWFAGEQERARAYAAELVQFKPDVIFAGTAPSLAALQRETWSLPVVFAQVTQLTECGNI